MEPGTRIGRYVVEDRVGHGGMAEVWRVRDERDAAWAMKVLTLDRPGVKERFLTEARIMLALDHPNLVRAREILETDGETALVMELVPGSTLDQWLYDHNPPVELLDRLARQILDGVGHAHDRGLVHRDLKPANVLILDAPDGPVAKVTDFGLAKQLAVAATRTGMTLGTPRYMAPEQIRDAKRVDARADLWSLGVVLCELYTGQTPFDQETMAEVFAAVLDARFVDPVARGAPERVAAAIRACLQKEPAERPRDTRDLAALLFEERVAPAPALSRIAVGPPADPGPTLIADEAPPTPARAGWGRLVAPWILAWTAALLLVAAVFGVGVVAIGAWTVGETVTEPGPSPIVDPLPAARPDRRPRRPSRR